MTVTVRVPSLRSLALIFAGVLLGAMLVAPVVARDATSPGATVQPRSDQSRVAGCAGLNFYPTTSLIDYSSSVTERWHSGTGSALFICDPQLPHRAVVTAVRFTVNDSSALGQVQNCALARHGQTTDAVLAIEVLASVPPTGPAAVPHVVRLKDTSIDFATINNQQYAYWLQCEVTNSNTGIFAASVTYTISSANG